ncbi:lipopolysaccharide biosynthesis protein [Nitrosopumilus maritimus]|uniref:Polysaccharide biosynthesis protein n=1 Tax=Nitrosopumilus maritimus (strain SCM1) TaxID=436308 RepID=A9A158_NITMS|nr:oligosaccharide flippase family protein [Nitrosopumilus maritimus]ABX12019.1 polysaccharide biosynthesis protein [Nitrosopumilus maritimus SCM1]
MVSLKDKIKNIKGIKDLTSIGFANISGNAISALFWFYLASLLTTTEYGELSYLISIAGLASVLSFVGGSHTITVLTAKKINILSTLVTIILLIGVTIMFVLYLLFSNLSISMYAISYLIYGVSIGEILGNKLYRTYSILFIVQKATMVLASILLYPNLGIDGVILGYAISHFVPGYRIFKMLKGKFSFSSLKPQWSFISNNYGLVISRAFTGQIDKIIIAPILGFALLGNYHLGIQFLSLLSILPMSMMQYILPQESTGHSHVILKKLAVIVAVLFAVLGIFLGPIILPHFFPKFESAAEIIPIMSLVVIPRTITAITNAKLLGILSTRFIVIGVAIYLTIQVSGILILGELYSLNGVAWALVLAEAGQAIFLYVSSKYFLKKTSNA